MPTLHDLLEVDQWVKGDAGEYARAEMNDGSTIMNEILIPLSSPVKQQNRQQTKPRFDNFDHAPQMMWSSSLSSVKGVAQNGPKADQIESEEHQLMDLSQELAMLDFDESFVSQQLVMEPQPKADTAKANSFNLSEPLKIDVQPVGDELLLTKTGGDLQISHELESSQQITLPVNEPDVKSNEKVVDPPAVAIKIRQKPGKKAMETKKYVQKCLTQIAEL